MKIKLIIAIISLWPIIGLSQEICNNGIDDDGDGLVDLNDIEDCSCTGLTTVNNSIVSSLIQNHSFEQRNCCPYTFSELSCATHWNQASDATSDFMHSCHYISPSVMENGLFPFPDGNGIVGAFYTNVYKEYVGTCLMASLDINICYKLTMHIAASNSDQISNHCFIGLDLDSIPITLYGNSDCNKIPFEGYDCPPQSDGWIELTSRYYTPTTNWQIITFEFLVPYPINSFIFGAPCIIESSDYAINDCNPYFIYDNLILTQENCGFDLNVTCNAEICSENIILETFSNLNNGTWQWYFEGIAISGETNPNLSLNAASSSNGTYTVVFQDEIGCYASSYDVYQLIESSPTVIKIETCGDFFWDEIGMHFFESVEFPVSFLNQYGCDSIVILDLTIFSNEANHITQYLCAGDSLQFENDVHYESGDFQYSYLSVNNCDSIIHLNIVKIDTLTNPNIYYNIPQCYGEIVEFTTEETSNFSIMWQMPSGQFETSPTLSIPFTQNALGEYIVFHILHGCKIGSNSALFSTNSNLYEKDLIIPNVLTVNGDGSNDYLKILGIPDGCYYQLDILNRWGQVVYTQHESNEPFKGYDGQGNELNEGVYFLKLTIGSISKSGFLHLIR
jgi:hypothetical protein